MEIIGPLSISLLPFEFKRYKHDTIQTLQLYTDNFRKTQ